MLRVTLLISMLIYTIAFLISCNGGGANNIGSGSPSGSSAESGGGTISFSDITYSRPDTVKLYAELSSAAVLIRNSKDDLSHLVEVVESADRAYSSYLTMYSYAELMHNKDSSDDFYQNEYSVLSKAYSDLYTARTRLSYEILCSEHKEELSKIGFTDTVPFKIADPDRISDDYFSLISHEEKLKYSYLTLSERNVYITYDGITDTCYSTINRLKEALGDGSQKFSQAVEKCQELYLEALTNQKLSIYASLINTRSLIASSLGYDSYNDYAYDVLNYTHTAEDYKEYAEEILEYMSPVYNDLSIKIFNPYFKNHFPKFLDKNTLLTNLLSIYKTIDARIYSAFGSMISAGLFDIASGETAKNGSSYVAYFNSKHMPFLFHKAYGDARDYLSVSYGFGNYFDIFVNKVPDDSSYETELIAKALEMITLSKLLESLDTDDSKYVYYLSMKGVMREMIYSSLLSLAEQTIYDMNPDDVNGESIALVLNNIAEKYSFLDPTIAEMLRNELVLTPKSLQAKTISFSYAAKIYFDIDDAKSKLQIYEALIDRANEKTLTSVLSSFGISSPFEEGTVMDLSDKIFYSINGYHYYKSNSDNSVA